MTYSEMIATGAEIVSDSFKELPMDGWYEVDTTQIRHIRDTAEQTVMKTRAHQSVIAYQIANLVYVSACEALKRAEAGARVFTVTWQEDRAFAATKHVAQR